MRPAEYLGYSSRDDEGARSSRSEAFRLEDITFTIRGTAMLAMAASLNEVNIEDITYATLTFTDQKNAVRGEQVGHWATADPTLCPCKALARLVMHIRSRPVPNDTPICTYHANDGTQRTVKATHITNALRHAADRLKDTTGIPPELISARSLRPGGATALLCANINKQSIQLLGRWKSDAMLRYLHVHAMNASSRFAQSMLDNGSYTFEPATTQQPDPDDLPIQTPPSIRRLANPQSQ